MMDDLSSELLEIDMIDFEGPAFATVDNRLMALYLVKFGLTHAAMFQANGKLVQPSEALYKKSVLIERSLFRPPTLLNMNILDSACDAFINEPNVDADDVIVLSEMTLQNLRDRDEDQFSEDINIDDFLHRVEILCALGKNVMISNFGEFYKLSQYLFRRTNMPIAIALGIPNLLNILNEKYYESLDGGILEAVGRLFGKDIRLYVCPMLDADGGELITVHNLKVQDNLSHLYRHLIENGYIKALETIDPELLLIQSNDILQKIRSNDVSWKACVPEKVVTIITERALFYKEEKSNA